MEYEQMSLDMMESSEIVGGGYGKPAHLLKKSNNQNEH